MAARRRARTVLRFALVAAVIVVGLVYFVDAGALVDKLAGVSPALFALMFAVIVLDQAFMGAKWNILLRAFQVRVRAMVPIAAYFRGRVLSLVTPTTIGTDAYKAYHLKKQGAPLVPVVSSIFVERALGLLSSLSIICLSLPFTAPYLGLSETTWIVAGSWVLFLAIWVLAVVLISNAERISGARIWQRLPGRARRGVHGFFEALHSLGGQRRAVVVYFLVSNVEKLAYGSVIYLSARSLGLDQVGVAHCLFLTPIVALLERIPISISAIGVREGLYVALLHPYGISATTAVSVALVVRAGELLMSSVILLLWGLSSEPPKSMALELESAEHEGEVVV